MLKLIKTRERKNIGISEEYEYGSFLINVLKGEEGNVEIEAHDKKKEIFIRKVNSINAILTLEGVYAEKPEEIKELVERLNEAKELICLINNGLNKS